MIEGALEEDRFMVARRGDHLFTSFQCDLCHFRNIKKRSPRSDTPQDALLMKCIRRASLDAFWSRETGTVQGNAREIKVMRRKLNLLGCGLDDALPAMGPFEVEDSVGMLVACAMLMRTLDPGRNEETVQYGTASKMRGAYSNWWHASVRGTGRTVGQQGTSKMMITDCPMNTDWFGRFMKGMHRRIGDKPLPDLAVSIEVMVCLMDRLEKEWERARSEKERRMVLFLALFLSVGYCGGLSGEEVPLMDIAGTRDNYADAVGHQKMPHVNVALCGKFKEDRRFCFTTCRWPYKRSLA